MIAAKSFFGEIFEVLFVFGDCLGLAHSGGQVRNELLRIGMDEVVTHRHVVSRRLHGLVCLSCGQIHKIGDYGN